MKHLLSIVIIFCFMALSCETKAQIKSVEKLLDAGKYNQAYNNLQKKYIQSPNNVEVLYMLAQYYSLSDNIHNNYRLAYFYTEMVWDNYVKAIHKKQGRKILRWQKKGITIPNIRAFQNEIAEIALFHATKINTVEAYTKIIDYFTQEPLIIAEAKQYKKIALFNELKNSNNIQAYKDFIIEYPNSNEAKQIQQLYNTYLYQYTLSKNSPEELITLLQKEKNVIVKQNIRDRLNDFAFQEAIKKGSAEAFRNFLVNNPTSSLYNIALILRDEAEFIENTASATANAYFRFAEKHSDSRFYNMAIDSMLSIAWRNKDIDVLDFYIKNYPLDFNWDKTFRKFYNWYTSDGELYLIEKFKKQYPEFPYEFTIENDINLAKKLDSIHIEKPFSQKNHSQYAELMRLFMGKDIAFVLLQRMLENLISGNNKNATLQAINSFDICFENDKNYSHLKELLTKPSNKNIFSKKAMLASYGKRWNSILSADGNALYFVMKRNGKQEIFSSQRNNGGFSTPEMILGLQSGDCPYWISENETKMLFGRDGDIYIAINENGYWIEKEKLPYPINTSSYEADATFTPDGNGILFVSDREGGKNLQPSGIYFHGDTLVATDIYYSQKTENGWNPPVNLGINLNTRYCERSPFLSSDMRTLYFSSDGYGGLGRLEIMSAERINDTSWTEWSIPENIGWEINSSKSDYNISLSQNGEYMYYTSKDAKNIAAIYEVKFKKPLFENKIHTININILNKSELPTDASVYLVDLKTSNILSKKTYKSSDENIQFKYLLGSNYGIFAYKRGYISTSVKINNCKGDVSETIILYQIKDIIDKDISVVLQNVYFDSLSTSLNTYSAYELKNLATQIKDRKCRIEIQVSANTGNEKQSFDISTWQATAIKSFLIQQGIAANRIETIGLGITNKYTEDKDLVKIKLTSL